MASDVNEKILKAIHSLRKDNPLRLQAEMVVSDPRASIEDLQPVLHGFGKRSQLRSIFGKDDQIVAAWLVKSANWSDTQRSVLAVALSKPLDTAAAARKLDRVINGVLTVFVLCFSFSFALIIIQMPELFGAVIGDVLEWVALVIAVIASNRVLERIFSLRQYRLVIETLGDLGHPASTGSISTAYGYGPYRKSAEFALQKVTANLQPQHYGTLPSETVPALCEALRKADHATIHVILNALIVIGDARAIKPVERLAMKPPSAEIGRAASELLPILQHRELASQSSTQLLRASEDKAAGQQELLRGVAGVNADEGSLLVRVAGVEHE